MDMIVCACNLGVQNRENGEPDRKGGLEPACFGLFATNQGVGIQNKCIGFPRLTMSAFGLSLRTFKLIVV